jgi:RNA polymerase sigma-70 factor (ECF subfamily)
MNTESDEKLAALYLAGQESALEYLLQKYLTPLYNFTAQFVGYGTEAEDVVQETFIKAWKNLKRFDQRQKFKPWLYRIARNTAIDFLRQRKAVLSIEDFDNEDKTGGNYFVDPKPLPLAHVSSLETKKALLAIINTLPHKYATVVTLYYLEDFSLLEIAEILSESVDTVKSKHRRALIRIRNLLAQDQSLLPP